MSRLHFLLQWLVVVVLSVGCENRQSAADKQASPAESPRKAAQAGPSKQAPPAHDATPNRQRPLQGGRGRLQRGVAADLHYVELLTGGARANQSLPMIVAIHGLGDRPERFAQLLRDFDAPARVILPRAVDAYHDGWSWFPVRARDEDVEALARGISASADRIAEAVTELRDRRPTVGRPIVTGFSQGGMLTFALAVHHPSSFSHAFPVGGWLPPPLWPRGEVEPGPYPPIEALHGTTDTAVAFEPTKRAIAHLREQSLQVELHPYQDTGHVISASMRADLHTELRAAVAALSAN